MATFDPKYNAGESLITGQEVIDNSPGDDHNEAADNCDFIIDIEEELFNKCFRIEFYQDLMDDRIKYVLTTPAAGEIQYSIFKEGQVYALGVYVYYSKHMYKVTQLTTGTQNPNNSAYFQKANKFATIEYDYIWSRYLKRIIAFSVTETSVFYHLVQVTNKGLVVKFSEGQSKGASVKEGERLKSQLIVNIDRMISNMESFIDRNKELAAFANYKTIYDGVCAANCKKKVRHYGFNTNSSKHGYIK